MQLFNGANTHFQRATVEVVAADAPQCQVQLVVDGLERHFQNFVSDGCGLLWLGHCAHK